MSRRDLQFWIAISVWSIVSIVIFKVVAAQTWVPDGLKKVAGFV